MKKSIALVALCASVGATSAPAGNLAEPVVAPAVVAADAVATSSDQMHQMLAVLTVALILTASLSGH